MLKLYHYYLCPSSRFIRLVLEECRVKYTLQLENYWKPQKVFLQINPAGHLPVLINESGYPIVGANACIEYFKDLNFKPLPSPIHPISYRPEPSVYREVGPGHKVLTTDSGY